MPDSKAKHDGITTSADSLIKKNSTAALVSTSPSDSSRPKNRKELRAERKNLKKKAEGAISSSSDGGTSADSTPKILNVEEKKALRKKHKKLESKEQRLLLIKEQRVEKKIRKQKRLRIEMNAPGGVKAAQRKKLKSKQNKASSEGETQDKRNNDQDSAMNVFNGIFNGTHDETTGATTLRMGVVYKDVVVGKGIVAEDRRLVTVSYKLKGGKVGAAPRDRKSIDSSKNFSFRVGEGEVIKGWEIGILGMQVGGTRQLIVPPKAGYGSQDIGAGSGATLYFDITLLSMR